MNHYAVNLPAQKNVSAPENAVDTNTNYDLSRHNGKGDRDYFFCLAICEDPECSGAV